MSVKQFILSLDQGTTSSRAILFAHDGRAVAKAQREFPQLLPAPGVVEHNPEDIWTSQLEVAREAIAAGGIPVDAIAGIGVTNQRETTILWDRATGRPVANAIVWQSRVTAPICDELKRAGLENTFRQKTGLVVDAYFSGTKIKHLLDTHDGLRRRAAAGEIIFGTVDSFLLWRLTGRHVTDVSNASRTLLFNIHTLDWDDELLRLLDIPRAMLPEVCSSSETYGVTKKEWFGREIPVSGCAGDQQAATFGQACFEIGSAKNTYGTGCFMLLNTGPKPVASRHNLLTTVGWKLGANVTYCLEGSVFIAGAVVQWLRDGLKLALTSQEIANLALQAPDAGGVVIVPAFVGLGAPYWDPHARGAVFGITRGTTAAHLARAAIESMAFQTQELLAAMEDDAGVRLSQLKVDGGASINDQLMQTQADLLDVTVRRPVVAETTALGAAYLAGLAVGYWDSTEDVARNWALDREFTPAMSAAERDQRCRRWKRAVERTLGWESD
jgi:glycerol kinase